MSFPTSRREPPGLSASRGRSRGASSRLRQHDVGGLESRWTMPWRWAWASAPAISCDRQRLVELERVFSSEMRGSALEGGMTMKCVPLDVPNRRCRRCGDGRAPRPPSPRARSARARSHRRQCRTRQDLDRDHAIEPRVAAFVHFSHAASADLGGDFVGAEAGARGEGQA